MILSVYLKKTELCKVHCSCLAAPPAPAPASSAVTCSGVLQGKDPPWHTAEGQPGVSGWTHSAETKQREFASLRFSPKDTPRSHACLPSFGSRLCLSGHSCTCRPQRLPCAGIDNASAITPNPAERPSLCPCYSHRSLPNPIEHRFRHRAQTNKGRSSYFR